MPTLKTCTKCGLAKELSSFNKSSSIKCGYRPDCRACQKVLSRSYLLKAEVISKRKQKQIEFKEKNPLYHSVYSREWAIINKDKLKKASIKYRLNNRDKIRQKDNANWQKNYYSNIEYRLKCLLRNRIKDALNSTKYKVGSAVKDLGCTVQHLKLHLELFWDEGMSWSNYGNKEGQWSIDHILPLSSFDLTDRDQFLKACHYTNLQPMWHIDNMSKHAKVL